jgi:ABC-type multidrug transport system fused ATPase/permease subunit
MGLKSLRTSISIIPQTPFIFKGSIRKNIDPFNNYNDELIWKVLKDCRLDNIIMKVILYI